ncbi:TPA: helix-turn-helix transcriptional regulator [Klebsiella pneumoniae]|uniref:helix-turn-helix transcriptional regulator n=1 Tax=Klebsiella pneumoniae TaxID=573 RepID=UPI0029C0CD88|nr:helix-turn-helix transcriptional regulator [Klebsiella pneumoniae]HBR4191183.1 helix-turn-helix transcriptional regulator [Klebsiella pneumoniae]HBW3975155.1 helix-turn-helix transcriptional regulator [Klebsiella pneumoniae]HBW4020421.1 helix-turn-helix transcriptional regulator [Klebsiella pneumoniae]HBW4036586.1 helix-turn-helix transcriptional regulator [Klebsiella pneumoniae]
MLRIEVETAKLTVGNSEFLIEIPKSLYEVISSQNKKDQLTTIKNNEAEKIEYFLRDRLYFDIRPPSKRQMDYIIAIAEKLKIKINKKVFESTSIASSFIDKHKDAFDKKIEEEQQAWVEYQKSDEYKILQQVEKAIKRHFIRYNTTRKKLIAKQLVESGLSINDVAEKIGVTTTTINKYLSEVADITDKAIINVSSWITFHYLLSGMVFSNKEKLTPSEWRDTFINLSMKNRWYEEAWFFTEE